MFDRRSRREAREDEAKFSLLERRAWLLVGVIAATLALVRYPFVATIAAGGIGVGGGAWAAWRRRTGQRGDGSDLDGIGRAIGGEDDRGYFRVYGPLDLLCEPMPVYEFECEECGWRFEELAPADTTSLACPECGAKRTRRLMSAVSPAGRQPRGAAVRSDESRRGEREAARRERIAESKRKRAAGESVRPQRGGGSA